MYNIFTIIIKKIGKYFRKIPKISLKKKKKMFGVRK